MREQDRQALREAVLGAVRGEAAVPHVAVNRQTQAAARRAPGMLNDFLATDAGEAAESITAPDGSFYFMLDASELDGDDVLE